MIDIKKIAARILDHHSLPTSTFLSSTFGVSDDCYSDIINDISYTVKHELKSKDVLHEACVKFEEMGNADTQTKLEVILGSLIK